MATAKTDPAPPSKRRAVRVLVALNAPLHSTSALEAAANLAARYHGELEALLIEDEELLSAANLPFTREIDRISGALRDIDSVSMARALKVQRQLLNRALVGVCGKLKVTSRVRVVRGEFLNEALTAAAEAEVAVLNRTSHGAAAPPAGKRMLRTAPAGGARHKPVWSLFDGSPAGVRALLQAGAVAAEGGTDLVVALPESAEGGRRKLEAEASELLGANAGRARFVVVPHAEIGELFQSMWPEGCSLLFLGRGSVDLGSKQAAAWLKEPACPVVVTA
jgi:hypothetical protein